MARSKPPLTAEERVDNDRLKEIWNSKKAELGLNQALLADAMSIGQSAVSHYLNGYNKLNAKIAAEFASLLDVDVAQFSPALAMEIECMASKAKHHEDQSDRMTVIDRIQALLAHHNIPKRGARSALQRTCGISHQAVSQWFTGETSNIKNEHLAAIADEFESSLDWLVTGKGPMIVGSQLLNRGDQLHQDIIKRIDVELIARGWSRADLARELGNYSEQRLMNWWRRGIPANEYTHIAQVFDWSVDRLLTGHMCMKSGSLSSGRRTQLGAEIDNWMASTTPRSRSALEQIATAATSGDLSEADLIMLEQIAHRLADSKLGPITQARS
ncbi:transcriptional regulator with XRE-family HTH domain [Marinobacterium sp. MBR-111]|jgi:transcriptional regulator with XRE-family HTH domain|uniref:helix-turn-helix transcriptional regulator n=1 Tax=Marinobacterium sp. MBR-111 TaxID=3156463 RepID=UPI0033918DEB